MESEKSIRTELNLSLEMEFVIDGQEAHIQADATLREGDLSRCGERVGKVDNRFSLKVS